MIEAKRQRKAVVFTKPGHAEVRNMEMPAMDDDSVLTETTFTSISRGTEMNLFHGRTRCIQGEWYAWYPMVPGYENVGRVIEVGKNVTHLKSGDRVLGDGVGAGFAGYCCAWGGQTDYALYNYSTHPSLGPRVPVRIPDNVSDEEALLVPLAVVSFNAFKDRLKSVEPGTTVLVIGQGAVGMSACQLARNKGARVIVADLYQERLEIVRQAGWADVICGRSEELLKPVADLTDGGPEVVVETTGSTECLSLAMQMVKPCGKIIGIGLYLNPMVIDICDTLWAKRLSLACSCGGTPEMAVEILDMISKGTFNAKAMISEVFNLQQIIEAYHRVDTEPRKILKAVVDWRDKQK